MKINEINVGEPDVVELYNNSSYYVNLENWALEWTDTNLTSGIIVLPDFFLGPGAYVQLMDICGPGNDSTHINLCDTLPWVEARGGSLTLYNELTEGVDFIRWGGDSTVPPMETSWSESYPLSTPAEVGEALARDD